MDLEAAIKKSRLSLEEYVQVCRQFPGFRRTIEIEERVGHLEGLIEEAAKFGVNKKAMQGALFSGFAGEVHGDVEERDVYEVALGLLEAILIKEKVNPKFSGHAVGRGQAIPDSVVCHLATALVESCASSDIAPPPTLSALIGFLLCGNEQGRMAKEARRPEAKRLAALLIAADEGLSDRQVGKAVGVDHTVIGRWKRDPAFPAQVRRIGKIEGIKKLMEVLTG